MAEFQKEFLMNISENGIHSIRTRVKDAEHLIVKIIRKRQENYKKYRTLDKDNYEKFLTDLIGIRCFILFKADWKKFHAYLEEKIEDIVKIAKIYDVSLENMIKTLTVIYEEE